MAEKKKSDKQDRNKNKPAFKKYINNDSLNKNRMRRELKNLREHPLDFDCLARVQQVKAKLEIPIGFRPQVEAAIEAGLARLAQSR